MAVRHLLPIGGDPNGPIFEGWTLLSALAAQTERLRLGLLVTSNRFRPPAMLAKIAATVDVVSGGRLDFGIGVGSRPSPPAARREYSAHGLPYLDFADAVQSLAEACTVIRRLWSEAEPFDFDGTYHRLAGAFCNPKPVQQPHPPIIIGGRTTATLRVAAEHADLWNIPGGDIDDCVQRSALLDQCCAEIGRDPASITRSIHLRVSYDQPTKTRDSIAKAVDAASDTSSSGSPRLIRKTSRTGPPTSSSKPRPEHSARTHKVRGRLPVDEQADGGLAVVRVPHHASPERGGLRSSPGNASTREGEKMSEGAPLTRQDLEAKIVARAWADEGFRQRLKTDPRGTVSEETGISVPESVQIEVVEETPEKAYLVIPMNRVAVSDEELELASGGNSPWDPR